MFENYNKDDVINELFMFTDALRDNGVLDVKEEEMLDELRERYYSLCSIKLWNGIEIRPKMSKNS